MVKPLHHNVTWDELVVGQTASIERNVTAHDLFVFAHASGNTNPIHVPRHDGTPDPDVVAPSMWLGSLVSSVLGVVLPGAGTLYREQNFVFAGRAHLGDRLIVTVRCLAKGNKPRARFETTIDVATGGRILEGFAEVEVPLEPIWQHDEDLPLLLMDEHDNFGQLLLRCRQLPPMRVAVVCPDDHNSITGIMLAAQTNLILPVLIGRRDAIILAAAADEIDVSRFTIIDLADPADAAAKAVAMANAHEVQAIMKGNIHSDLLLAEIVKKDGGLRTSRRISHVFAFDIPTKADMLFISDAAINIAPDLAAKVDITQNAIDLARACGIELPKVGILAAVETVNANMPSTLDAAALSKMADRGQIKGGLVDGPLAMDNAVDVEAARTKGITSLVAGRAQVLIVPNLEAGNMLAKELTFVARAEAAGLIVGARVPVIFTSRADSDKSRLASCALAQLLAYWNEHGRALQNLV